MDQSKENWTAWMANKDIEFIEMSRQDGDFSWNNDLNRWRWGNKQYLEGKAVKVIIMNIVMRNK